jgi:hypothetical protein
VVLERLFFFAVGRERIRGACQLGGGRYCFYFDLAGSGLCGGLQTSSLRHFG